MLQMNKKKKKTSLKIIAALEIKKNKVIFQAIKEEVEEGLLAIFLVEEMIVQKRKKMTTIMVQEIS